MSFTIPNNLPAANAFSESGIQVYNKLYPDKYKEPDLGSQITTGKDVSTYEGW